jgi:hypothetical protein
MLLMTSVDGSNILVSVRVPSAQVELIPPLMMTLFAMVKFLARG